MITSERQLKASKEQLVLLKNAKPAKKGIAPEFQRGAAIQVKAKIQELTEAIERYEELRERGIAAITVASPLAFLIFPIEFRIAKRMTQEDFAELVDIPLRQIARYEKSGYREINGENLAKILDKLSTSIRLDGHASEISPASIRR